MCPKPIHSPPDIDCQDTAAILKAVEDLKPFRAVIEATGTYRWLYDLLSPHGSIRSRWPTFPRRTTNSYGMGVFSALVVIGELDEVERFRAAKQVGAYAGLTCRVHQSGSHCYHGKQNMRRARIAEVTDPSGVMARQRVCADALNG